MTRRSRVVGAVALLAGTVLVPPAASATTLPAAATTVPVDVSAATTQPGSDPSPTPTHEAPTVSPDVAVWFAAEVTEVVEGAAEDLGVEAAAAGSLAVGSPRQVSTWTPAYIAGTPGEPPTEPVAQWVAPVVLQSDEAPEPRGVVQAAADDGGGMRVVDVVADVELATALSQAPASHAFVYDDGVEGWFARTDGEILPVTEGARTVLRGALSVEVFQTFLTERLGGADATAIPGLAVEEEESMTPLLPIAVIVVVGGVAAWLLLRQYRQTDSRIAADVHAEVSPPPYEDADAVDDEASTPPAGIGEDGPAPEPR